MSEQEKIPPGWIKVKSKTRGRYYYYHKEKKLSVWKLSDCDEPTKIATIKVSTPLKDPKLSPKKKPRSLTTSSGVLKKNIASDRLKKLQQKLRHEANSILMKTKDSKEVNEKAEPAVTTQSNGTSKTAQKSESFLNGSTSTLESTFNEKDESTQMDIDEQLDKSTESLKDYEEEPMEWEDIDVKLVVQEVHNVRTKDNASSLSTIIAHSDDSKLSQNDFYIIVDTNVLLSNLPFVKQIKSKFFKDIGRAYIYLPYIVLCELDRLKLREENISRLARCAISYIDNCFKAKDEFLLGQNAMESSRELIEIDSGDDYIINSALQLREKTSKIILLSNDKNLRNKSFVNGIEAFSSDTLNYADYNVSNSIKFE